MEQKTKQEIDRIKEDIRRTVRERDAVIRDRLALMEVEWGRRRRWPFAGHGRRGYVNGEAGFITRLLAVPFMLNGRVRESFISYGLKHKERLKKIPLFNNAFKRLYRTLRQH